MWVVTGILHFAGTKMRWVSICIQFLWLLFTHHDNLTTTCIHHIPYIYTQFILRTPSSHTRVRYPHVCNLYMVGMVVFLMKIAYFLIAERWWPLTNIENTDLRWIWHVRSLLSLITCYFSNNPLYMKPSIYQISTECIIFWQVLSPNKQVLTPTSGKEQKWDRQLSGWDHHWLSLFLSWCTCGLESRLCQADMKRCAFAIGLTTF